MFHFARPSGYAPINHRQGYPTGYSPRSSFDANYMVAQEEAAIRQRLADIEVQRQQTYYNPGHQYRHEDPLRPSPSPQDSRLAALRREVELEEQRYAAAVQRQEEQVLEARLNATRQRRRALETPTSRAPHTIKFVLDAEPQRIQRSAPLGHCVRQSGTAKGDLNRSSGYSHHPQISVNRAQANAPSSEAPFLELLSSILGVNVQQQNSKPAYSFQDVLQPGCSSAPTRKLNRAQTEQGASSQRRPEASSLQDVLSHMMMLASESLGQETQQQPTTQSEASSSSTVPATLKDELERRLHSDESVEIKDTIQAIMASLRDSDAPSTTPASSSSASSSETSKGKGEAELTPSASPTHALDTIHNIQTAYTTLESEFTFPPTLDFSTSDPSNRLAYTPGNLPIRQFEQSLSGLITKLDEIETAGNEELRSKRKELVNIIEKRIEALDMEIEGIWNSQRTKDEQEQEQATGATEAEEESARESEATVHPYDVDDAPEPTSTPSSLNSEVLDTEPLLDIEATKEKKDSDSEWSEVEA